MNPHFYRLRNGTVVKDWMPGKATEGCERDFLRLVSGVSNSKETRGGTPETEAKRINEPRTTTPTGDQTLSFQYPLRGALWTFCSPKRRSSAVATESGRLRSCSAKSRSPTTTSPVGYR